MKVAMKSSRVLEGNPVVPVLRERIAKFQETMPIVVDLRNESLADRHWEEITELLGHDIPVRRNR
jgi:hypothetical protein